MTANRNVFQLVAAGRARGYRRRDPDEPVYIFVLSTTRHRRIMKGIADHMMKDDNPDEFLADHLEIERWRLQELEMPPDQIERELGAIARTVRAMVWKVRREARA